MSTPTATPRRYGNLVAAIATVACCDIAMGLALNGGRLVGGAAETSRNSA